VVELQEEVTQVQAAAIMVKARTTQAEGMAQEKTALLVTAHSEAVEATQRVSILGDKFVAARWARVAVEGKVLSLAVVSLAAQSILVCWPIDASQAGVVGEMVIQF
jgi:hypothetical protein